MDDDQMRQARFKVIMALAAHAKMHWSPSMVNASACIDGPTFLVVLIFDIDGDCWVTTTVDIVNGHGDTTRWGQDPSQPIMAAERWARGETY